jgi:NADH dehydrogenase
MEKKPAHVVVLGAGFGGLTFCQEIKSRDARITLVDRTNHHLFQPLLYQVATAGLSAPEIAQPIRSILSDHNNVTVLLDEVIDFNLAKREVVLRTKTLIYDFLVLALGGCNNYFGHPEWEQFAPGLKNLNDAVRIRSKVLLAFERAENTEDVAEHTRLMTVIIIGGGPTGVELAGAFAELARHVLRRDFRHIDPAQAKIILIEGGPRILSNLPEDLSESATRQLKRLGAQIRTGVQVKNIRRGEVELANGEKLAGENILWAAGVSATPLTQKLGAELDRAGRVKVNSDLSVPAHPEVFAIGDLALVLQKDGKPVPGVSPAAMQMARHVARIIDDELVGIHTTRSPFKYWDKGTMATIGRSKAVAQVGRLKLSGLLAWLAWLALHLVFLIGFRNKITVMIDWMYSYFAYKRGARIIMSESPKPDGEND